MYLIEANLKNQNKKNSNHLLDNKDKNSLFESYMIQISNGTMTLTDARNDLDPDNLITLEGWKSRRRRFLGEKTLYNKEHRKQKNEANKRFWSNSKFDRNTTVADFYAGEISVWKENSDNVISNDKCQKFKKNHKYHNSAHIALKNMKKDGYVSFDFVDLDSFGSNVDIIEDALQLATKGFAVTLGEFSAGYNRGRVKNNIKFQKCYGISFFDLKPETRTEQMIECIIKIGIKYNKKLTLVESQIYSKLSRVYFKID